MVIDIPTEAGKVPDLKQRDVRENATSSFLNLKTSYLSIPGAAFTSRHPDVDDVSIEKDGIMADADGIVLHAPVFLPQGATVTAIIVYGNAGAAGEIYDLIRYNLSNQSFIEMSATININTEDTTITSPIIDNSTYGYTINTSSLDTNDEVYGARITYKTHYA